MAAAEQKVATGVATEVANGVAIAELKVATEMAKKKDWVATAEQKVATGVATEVANGLAIAELKVATEMAKKKIGWQLRNRKWQLGWQSR